MGEQDLQGVGTGSERGKNSFTIRRFLYEKPGRQTMGKSQQAGLRQLRKDQVIADHLGICCLKLRDAVAIRDEEEELKDTIRNN